MNLAIIGAGYMASLFATKARELGIETHCFAWDKGAVAKSLVDMFYPISITEKDEILRICRSIPIDGVVATTELTLTVANYVAMKMGLTCNPQNIMDNVTDKSWQRERCKQAKKIKQPEYIRLQTYNEAKYILQNISFPIIIKPVAEGGKRGIEVVKNKTEFEESIRCSFDADKHNKGVIIEEYLDCGKEYSVESISYQGKHQIIQITEKISSGPPHCVELGHSQPANIQKTMRNHVISGIQEILSLIGYQNGPAHTEIKIIDEDVFLIEVNARPGGDHIAHPLTLLSTGYDYLAEAIKVALGIKPASFNGENYQCSGVRFLTKQTAHLKALFDTCDNKDWLYEKHKETVELVELNHNDCSHTNYIIYAWDTIPHELT